MYTSPRGRIALPSDQVECFWKHWNANRSGHNRLRIKINLIPNLAAMLTGHGKTRAYLNRFKLRDDVTCICGQGYQTTDHLLNQCTTIHTQREVLKQCILKNGNWPASKQELVTKYKNSFIAFIESINFELL
jgi:hypothetical protein